MSDDGYVIGIKDLRSAYMLGIAEGRAYPDLTLDDVHGRAARLWPPERSDEIDRLDALRVSIPR